MSYIENNKTEEELWKYIEKYESSFFGCYVCPNCRFKFHEQLDVCEKCGTELKIESIPTPQQVNHTIDFITLWKAKQKKSVELN